MIKTLAGSLRENKKGSVTTVLLSILEAAFEILIPLCMAKVIDDGIEPENMNAVWRYGLILLVLAAFQLLTGVLCAHTAARAAVGFSANLRQDMYDNVQTFAFSNIDKFSTASIVTRLTTDVTNIQNAYQMLIRMSEEYELSNHLTEKIMKSASSKEFQKEFMRILQKVSDSLPLMLQLCSFSCTAA